MDIDINECTPYETAQAAVFGTRWWATHTATNGDCGLNLQFSWYKGQMWVVAMGEVG